MTQSILYVHGVESYVQWAIVKSLDSSFRLRLEFLILPHTH